MRHVPNIILIIESNIFTHNTYMIQREGSWTLAGLVYNKMSSDRERSCIFITFNMKKIALNVFNTAL